MHNTGFANAANIIERNNELLLMYTYGDSISTGATAIDTTLYANTIDIGISKFSLTGNHISSNEIKSDSIVAVLGRGLYDAGNQIRLSFRITVQ